MGRIRRHLRSNVVGYIALFFALSTGSAVALGGSNTVFTDDIANDTQPAGGGNPAGGLVAADLRPNSVGSSEVTNESLTTSDIKNFSLGNGDFLTGSVDTRVATNNSLTGGDVKEASLGQVPSALLGGFGRSTGDGSCNPGSDTFTPCAVVTLNLPKQARLLLIAQAIAARDGQDSFGIGSCRIGTTSGPLLQTERIVDVDSVTPVVNFSLAGVSGPFPPGQHSFGIDCNETSGGIRFLEAGISAVAISPN
jgi:hypothetical protein